MPTLLNPELKGKIVFADPQASSSSFEHLVNMLYAMGTDGQPNGWDYVREFCKQLPNGCVNSSSAVYKGVADGEYAVGPDLRAGRRHLHRVIPTCSMPRFPRRMDGPSCASPADTACP